jgi:hypothetical protein
MHIYRRGKTYWVRAQRQNREYRRSLKTTDRTIADRRARAWLGELDAIAWGEKPRRSYAEAEEKFIREHLTAIKPRAAQRYGVSPSILAVRRSTRSQARRCQTSRLSAGCRGYRRQPFVAISLACHHC